MKIEIARNSGFCMGVRDAIVRIVGEINNAQEPIYVYGPLIHNPQTMSVLEKRGLITIHDLENLDGRTIAIRTHGIPLANLKDIRGRSRRYINLTCPRVARVQGLIKKHSRNGVYTIIAGDQAHAEVEGLMSYAQSGVSVISTPEEIDSIPSAPRYLLISQTTFDTSLFDRIVERASGRLENLVTINTICDSTSNRQHDVISAVRGGIDALVVVGGKNSANTRRLARIGTDHGIKTFHVETEDELEPDLFRGVTRVLVTAGASTPGWIINRILERLYDISFENRNRLLSRMKKTAELVVRTNLFSAFGALCVTAITQLLAGYPPDPSLSIVSFLYIFSVYTINNYFDIDFIKVSNPYKHGVYSRHKRFLLPVAVTLILISAAIMAIFHAVLPFVIFFASAVLGVVYSSKKVKGLIRFAPLAFVRSFFTSKNIISSVGWTVISVIIPLIAIGAPSVYSLLFGVYVFAFMFFRNTLLDVIALHGDIIIGRETLPVLLGIDRTRALLGIIALAACAGIGTMAFHGGEAFAMLFALPFIYGMALLQIIIKTGYVVSIKFEMLVEMMFVVLGAASLSLLVR